MQGHGHDQIGAVEQVGARARHPRGEGRRVLRAVGVFEGEHQFPAGRFVAQRRACLGEGGRAREARRAFGGTRRQRREVERQTAARAKRTVDPAELRPARGAKCMRFGNGLAASNANRRHDRVESGAPRANAQLHQSGDAGGEVHGRRAQHENGSQVNVGNFTCPVSRTRGLG